MQFSKQERIVCIILSIFLVFSIAFFLYKTWWVSPQREEHTPKSPVTCVVQIAGEVIRPGVYQVEEGTRLYQLVEMAGGSTSSADLSGLNLAAPVLDGQRINIPALSAGGSHAFTSNFSSFYDNPANVSSEETSNTVSRININTATLEDLKKLPGIGDVIAQRIIEYRQAHGPFSSADDLLGVKGIGTKKLENIRDLISF